MSGLDDDRKEFLKSKTVFKSKYRYKHISYINNQNLRLSDIKDPNMFWQELRKIQSKKTIEGIAGNEWIGYFTKLLENDHTKENIEKVNEVSTHDRNCDLCDDNLPSESENILNEEISVEEVIRAIKNLPKNKSPGEDGITNECLSTAAETLAPFITKVFNIIFNTGVLPNRWTQGIICPIHKKGNTADPNNYRGITLLNSLSKLLSSVLNNRLQLWCQENDLLYEEQSGFRKGYSTVDNMFSLMTCIQKYICKPRGRFYTTFVDFSKAFDSVIHSHLWTSIINNGIHGKMLKMLRAMYENMKACIKTKKGLTEYFECEIGTRQGDILSPLLFILHLNEFLKQQKKRKYKVYTSQKNTHH